MIVDDGDDWFCSREDAVSRAGDYPDDLSRDSAAQWNRLRLDGPDDAGLKSRIQGY